MNTKLIFWSNILIFVLIEIAFWYIKLFWLALAGANILLFVNIFFFLRARYPRGYFLRFFILPFLLLNGAISYLVLIPQSSWLVLLILQIAIVFLIWFNYRYAKLAYVAFNKAAVAEKLFSWSSLFAFIAIFLIAASLYGLQSFLGIANWIFPIILTLAATFLTYDLLWLETDNRGERWQYTIVSAFLFFQFAWVLYFLPFNYNVLGLLFLVGFYLINNLISAKLRLQLNANSVRRLLALFVIVVGVCVLSSRWQ